MTSDSNVIEAGDIQLIKTLSRLLVRNCELCLPLPPPKKRDTVYCDPYGGVKPTVRILGPLLSSRKPQQSTIHPSRCSCSTLARRCLKITARCAGHIRRKKKNKLATAYLSKYGELYKLILSFMRV